MYYIFNPILIFYFFSLLYMLLKRENFVIAIASLYSWTGKSADIIMVNSAWTENNINSIWKCPKKVHIIYPPIGLEKLMVKADSHWDKKLDYQIVNASEFKQENNHELILKAISKSKLSLKQNIWSELSLHLINLSSEQDEPYIKNLKDLVKSLNLQDHVKIYSQCIHSNHLEEELIKASYGIYAKADDHFGSDMIAGLTTGQIMIVHNSGAAKNELISTDEELRNGYLAKTVDEYSDALVKALKLPHSKKRKIQKAARRTAEQFSRSFFQKEFLKLTECMFACKKK